VLARDDRRRLFGLGNQLWHSDSSFKDVPAKYSLLSARTIPPTGGNTEFADMRAAYDALDEETKREVHDLVCRHSQIFSRGILGFTDFTEEERVKWAPVRQRLVRRHPSSGRLSLYLASHAGGIEGQRGGLEQHVDAIRQPMFQATFERRSVIGCLAECDVEGSRIGPVRVSDLEPATLGRVTLDQTVMRGGIGCNGITNDHQWPRVEIGADLGRGRLQYFRRITLCRLELECACGRRR